MLVQRSRQICSNMTMKTLFQRWLILFVTVAFIITVYVSYTLQSKQANEKAKELLRVNLADATRQLERNNENLKVIREMTKSSAIAKARAFAALVWENPNIATNPIALSNVKRILDVDEVCVTDGKIIVGSIPDTYLNFDMSTNPQSAEFVPAISDKNFEYVQDARENAFGKIIQYAGAARLDKPGIIEISYAPTRLIAAEKIADFTYIADNFRIGQNGCLKIKKLEECKELSADKFNELGEYYYNDNDNIYLAKKVGDVVLIGNLPNKEMYVSRDYVVTSTTIAYLVLFFIIFLLISNLLQTVVIDGIYSVNDSLTKIKEGNLDEKVEVHTAIEFDDLSVGINTTVDSLKELKEKEARRIDADLKIGHDIQYSVIPTDFPTNEAYELFAGMYTAKEVGGDFYDFFKIDDTHEALVIADVSGKGITAALYMMTAKTLIKELLVTLKNPAEAIERANLTLVKGKNKVSFMFVTVFAAVYNTETGELVCVNAGHNPPLLKTAAGEWEYQKIKHSVALGISQKAKFTNVSLQLNKGDSFLMYTDGVTEAMNWNNEQYGEKRLKEFLDEQTTEPKQVVEALRDELADYRKDFPQSDDITILMIKA